MSDTAAGHSLAARKVIRGDRRAEILLKDHADVDRRLPVGIDLREAIPAKSPPRGCGRGAWWFTLQLTESP